MRKIKYSEPFVQLVVADFKLRYTNSLLGIVWSLFKPFLLFLIYYIVFSFLIKVEIENYIFFLLSGIILWNFVVDGTMNGMFSLVGKAHIIKKIYFPRSAIVAAACLNSFILFLLNLSIFFLFMIFFSHIPSFLSFLGFFILLIFLFIFIFGLSLILSLFYVTMRDLSHMWEVLLQLWFWISPIVYGDHVIPQRFLRWYYLNPLAGFIKMMRNLILENQFPDYYTLFLTIFITLLILIGGGFLFRKYSGGITDNL